MSCHFGLIEGTGITNMVSISGYTIIVYIDCFGNIAYIELGAFRSANDYACSVDRFLRDECTETDGTALRLQRRRG